jgi:hypothetical protein
MSEVVLPRRDALRFDKELPSEELLVENEIANTLDNQDWVNVEDEIPHVLLSGKRGIN